MMIVLETLHLVAGIVVLAEALNKIERIDVFTIPPGSRNRAIVWLKLMGWLMLALGSAGALVTPMHSLEPPSAQDVCVLFGFATLVLRSRLREVPAGAQRPEVEDFTRTLVLQRVVDASPVSDRRNWERTNAHLQPNIEAARDLAADLKERQP